MAKRIRAFNGKDIQRAYIEGANDHEKMRLNPGFRLDVERQLKRFAESYFDRINRDFFFKKKENNE